jgi:regulator of protease activity HflC (stomatin/prohibitin superfamily)
VELHQKVLGGFCAFLLAIVLFFVVFSCDWVGPGNVGIVVHGYGNNKGVDNITTQVGYIWYNRWMTRVYEYPTSLVRTSFTKDSTEESPTNEEVTFNAKGGISVGTDVALHFQIDANKAPIVFVKLRNDIKGVREYLKSKVREALINTAETMTINEIYNNKAELINKARILLKQNIGDDINIEMLTFCSALRIDPKIEAGINATIAAEQAAIAAENKVAQSKAEADQRIEDARGRAESVLLEANKQAEANVTLAKSLTPELVQWQAIQKWDSRLPTVISGTIPFINIDGAKK